MSGIMRMGPRPKTPEQTVKFVKDLRESFDELWCPYCNGPVDDSLSAHVQNAHGLLPKHVREDFPGIPLTSKSFKENCSEGQKDDFGLYDWDRLDTQRQNIVVNKEWLLRVEKSQLIPSEEQFDELVKHYNAQTWESVKHGVATSLLIALNEYSYIDAKGLGDQLDVDPVVLRRRRRDHPNTSADIRTPQELLRDRLRDVDFGDESFASAYEEVLSYPEEFRFGGRQPATIAALAAWRGIPWLTQKEAGEMFGVTTVAIRNARDDLENQQG